MRKLFDRIAYALLYAVVYPLSMLPLRVHYVLSDVFFLLLYYIIRYRRRLVARHLAESFPEMTDAERRQTERRFYHWLCDYVAETVKMLTASDRLMMQLIEFRGVEQMEECFDRGQSCAAILGHYCNWEWLSAAGLAFKRYPQAVMGLIYHPLYNHAFNRLFIRLRSAHGGVCIPKKDILRYLVKYRSEGRMSLFGYISDQTPKWENIHLWLPFLNHDTPVFTGGERLMRKMNNAVFYADMERPRRGHYVCTFKLMTTAPAELPDNEITRRFFLLLEESIRRQPEFYLWTHNRWKRTREEFEARYSTQHGRVTPKESL